jgi:beta-glucosidase
MASYNRINGQFSMGNHDLLTSILRDDWGYKGMVMTDWIGIREGLRTIDEVHAGNDLLEPGQQAQIDEIVAGVKEGKLDMKDVNRNVRRMLEYIVKTPSFRRYPASNAPDFKAHAQITRQSAAEGMVMLKNNGTLPWNVDKATIDTVALFGVNSYDFLSGGTGSGCVHTPYVVDMVEGLKNAGINSSETLTDIYRKYVEYARAKFQADRHPARWYQMEMFGQQKYPEVSMSPICINNEVKAADAAIVTIGRQAGEGVDREVEGEFNLTTDERQMIFDVCNAFHAAGKPVVVVINSGSVVETASWSSYPDAILVAWQPGEEGGNSVADILTGKVSPSGKLTMTWPIAATDHPSTQNFPGQMDFYTYDSMKSNGKEVPSYDYTNHEEDIYVGYRYFDSFNREVAYPFGFGLSYTKFEYGKPTVKVSGDNITLSVAIKNVGRMSGKEVAQVYVSAPQGKLEKPEQELKAFGKTRELKPGETQTLTMTMKRRDLASFDEANSQWLVEAGNYTFRVGASSRDIRGTVVAKMAQLTEKVSNVLAPKQELKLMKQ